MMIMSYILGGINSDLGKRKNRWDEDQAGGMAVKHRSINASLNIIESYDEEGRLILLRRWKKTYTTIISHRTAPLCLLASPIGWCDSYTHVCIYIVGMKQSRKIYVPVKEHPEINYLGLLIGPQGSTQKQLSASTGARIVIRGRGRSNSRDW